MKDPDKIHFRPDRSSPKYNPNPRYGLVPLSP